MEMKNLVIQKKMPMWTDWNDDKKFNYKDFDKAIQRCDQLAKQLGKYYVVRVFDLNSKLRVYPYQKDKTGKEIIPKF